MKLFYFILFIFCSTLCQAELPSIEKLIGQFDEKQDNNFIALDDTILPTNKAGMYLQKVPAIQLVRAYRDFKKVHPTIPFIIVSATRNYDYQNEIWQRKWLENSEKSQNESETVNSILKYSSMPGTSRHHWGTDVDITSLSSSYFNSDPQGKILFDWLVNNMPKYGFCRPYGDNRDKGYQPEEWHWSYKPISRIYLRQFKYLFNHDKNKILNKLTFQGADKIDLESLSQEFIFNINSECD